MLVVTACPPFVVVVVVVDIAWSAGTAESPQNDLDGQRISIDQRAGSCRRTERIPLRSIIYLLPGDLRDVSKYCQEAVRSGEMSIWR